MKNKIGMGFAIVLVLATTAGAISIGAAPATIEFEKMVRGGYAEREISVGTSGDDNLSITVDVTGSIKNWITIQPGTTFTLSPKSSYRLKAIAQPSLDAANGEYNGEIVITAAPVATVGQGTGMSVGAGVILKVKLSVTGEEVVAYTLRSVSVKDTEVSYPVKFNVTIRNDGNVRVQPNLRLDVYADQAKTELLSSMDYSEMEILPTVMQSAVIDFSTEGLDVGRYWADVISDIGGEQTLSFDILPRGTLAMKGKLNNVRLSKVWVQQDEIVKVSASFVNEGELLIEGARFMGEAYLINDQFNTEDLVGTFSSEAFDAPVGEEIVLDSYFTPKESGRYSIRGSVVYEGKATPQKGSILNVLSTPPNYTPYYIGVGLVVIVIVYYLLQKGEDGRTRRFKKLWGDYLSIK